MAGKRLSFSEVTSEPELTSLRKPPLVKTKVCDAVMSVGMLLSVALSCSDLHVALEHRFKFSPVQETDKPAGEVRVSVLSVKWKMRFAFRRTSRLVR